MSSTKVCVCCWDVRGQLKHHRCDFSGIDSAPGCRTPTHRRPACVREQRSKNEAFWVIDAAEPTQRRSNDNTWEWDLRSARDRRLTRSLSCAWVTNLFNSLVSCQDLCSELRVFGCTTNTLIKCDEEDQRGRTWLQWLTQPLPTRFWVWFQLRPGFTRACGS